eukprot:2722266-Amphidinium_carterae.1
MAWRAASTSAALMLLAGVDVSVLIVTYGQVEPLIAGCTWYVPLVLWSHGVHYPYGATPTAHTENCSPLF